MVRNAWKAATVHRELFYTNLDASQGINVPVNCEDKVSLLVLQFRSNVILVLALMDSGFARK